MLRSDVQAMLNLLGDLWPWFSDDARCTPAQRDTIAEAFSRFRGTRDQADAVLRGEFRQSDKGFPPLARICKRLEQIDGDARMGSKMNDEDKRRWLADRIATVAKARGLDALLLDDPRTNTNARSWCRAAKAMGMNVAAIAAEATGQPEADVRAALLRATQKEAAP